MGEHIPRLPAVWVAKSSDTKHHYFDFTLRALSETGNFTSLPDNEQIPGTSVSPMGTSTTFGMFKCEMKAGCQFAFSFAAMPATCLP